MIVLLLYCLSVLFSTICLCSPIYPVDGMTITTDTVFIKGTYTLPKGVFIGASGITLDLNGATLIGFNFTKFGITNNGHSNVTIKNGVIKGYYYAIFVSNTNNIRILNNDLSYNWVDPAAFSKNPPWLNIFVTPDDIDDRSNFGGGIFMNGVSYAVISNNKMSNQENGVDMFYVNYSTISFNEASNNTGWGIHLFQSHDNKVLNNSAVNCTRSNLGDSAGILVACSSHHNLFSGNNIQGGGDGMYLTWSPVQKQPICCTNDYNIIEENDGSYAGANAFESDFNRGNIFRRNKANWSNFGFWLGYSIRGNIVEDNIIVNNKWVGIAIDHGQDSIIKGNLIHGNGQNLEKETQNISSALIQKYTRLGYPPPWQPTGVLLWTDLTDPYPVSQFVCLSGYDHKPSRNYTLSGNSFIANVRSISLQNTTESLIYNNYFGESSLGGSLGIVNGTSWNLPAPRKIENIIHGEYQGGNYYSLYPGCDKDGDGIGDTDIPYTDNGSLIPGDMFPLTNKRC
eukprot:TRINITY_DN7602_c0_g6_i1.p1 TRINITY_DN7602_c0_g6~~TRINITY_DN7602_c0_g6_i1.p1  ORF type:complete len:511 (-),score=69.25 TRINITY_DN7602_c0_g6_i1:20-1552(-)